MQSNSFNLLKLPDYSTFSHIMDHARHLSSPSPTSPFLFHHSERPFKSNPLTPLLSSTADVNNVVDDCFSTTSSSISSHRSHNPFVLDHSLSNHLKLSQGQHHTSQHHRSPAEDDLYHNQDDSALLDNTNASNHGVRNRNDQLDGGDSHHQQFSHSQNQDDDCVAPTNIDRDSLGEVDNDDDDDDGMHNMLSGSSTSSTSTIPLLTDSHSHPFSRISLGEYSPLSLVDDCDNALPISPTLGAHSFKSSLNGCLKMDNLVGDDVDDDGRVVVHDEGDDDARSLSPSVLNSSQHQQNSLWSTSSTAITQSTSLLNGSSSSYLLSSQHHHHPHHHQQLNSLIQQLEPQSLDEPPPLISDISGSGCTNFQNKMTLSSTSRPSSEPPPSLSLIGSNSNSTIESVLNSNMHAGFNISHSISSKQSQRGGNMGNKSCSQQGANNVSSNCSIKGATSDSTSTADQAPPSRPRRSRNRSRISTKKQSKSTSKNFEPQQQQLSKKLDSNNNLEGQQDSSAPIVHSSKLHLQLNHHKKLQELQRRLFGTPSTDECELNKAFDGRMISSNSQSSSGSPLKVNQNAEVQVKEEPDSSAGNKGDTTTTTNDDTGSNTIKTTRSRPTRNRVNRQMKVETSHLSPSSSSASTNNLSGKQSSIATNSRSQAQKVVTAETAEPDTTTISSDSIKLADLLNNCDVKPSNSTFIFNSFTTTSSTGSNQELSTESSRDGNGKRVQQIQVQVNPSLTVVANGGLVQSANIQQQQQHQLGGGTTNSSSAGGSNGNSYPSQIVCRPQTVVATTTTSNGRLKSIMSNSDLKGGDTVLSSWPLQAVSAGNNSNGSGHNISSVNNTNQIGISANGQTIGAHQIAIQVICQDGTSLVLPVSSPAGLNAAVSLTSQHQQLQAVLATTAANQQRNPNSQLLPLVSVSNLVAQHQVVGQNQEQLAQGSSNSSGNTSSSLNTSSSAGHPVGLAASSPTLAALLDAGSVRNSSNNNNNGNSNDLSTSANGAPPSQSFVSTNLLRKLVGGNQTDSKQQLNLSATSSMLTVCAPPTSNTNNSTVVHDSVQYSVKGNPEKRVKLEGAAESGSINKTTTFTMIDPHNLVVTTAVVSADNQTNEAKQIAGKQAVNTSAGNDDQQQKLRGAGGLVRSNQVEQSRSSKMGLSTGNRQVDPTQPFRCEHCNSTFTRLGNFTRHKKIHTVPTKVGVHYVRCTLTQISQLLTNAIQIFSGWATV